MVRARRLLKASGMADGAICFLGSGRRARCSSRPPFRLPTDVKTAPFVGYAKYVRYHADYQVNADGTDVESREWAMKVLTEQGVAIANQASVSFSDRLQDSEILSAYTLKADGRRIDVPPTNFQVESNTGKGKVAPIFSDIKTKTVAFPDVGVGDTVVLSYKTTQKEPSFPGNFSMMESFSPFQVYDTRRGQPERARVAGREHLHARRKSRRDRA